MTNTWLWHANVKFFQVNRSVYCENDFNLTNLSWLNNKHSIFSLFETERIRSNAWIASEMLAIFSIWVWVCTLICRTIVHFIRNDNYIELLLSTDWIVRAMLLLLLLSMCAYCVHFSYFSLLLSRLYSYSISSSLTLLRSVEIFFQLLPPIIRIVICVTHNALLLISSPIFFQRSTILSQSFFNTNRE